MAGLNSFPKVWTASSSLCLLYGNSFTEESKLNCLTLSSPALLYKTSKFANWALERVFASCSIKPLKTLDKIFDLDINKKEIWIFEKDNIRSCDKKEYKSKDGIHLVFPKIIADKKLYSYFIDLIHEEKELFNEIISNTCSHTPDNSMKDIIDKSVYTGNWLIYGSRKKELDTYIMRMF